MVVGLKPELFWVPAIVMIFFLPAGQLTGPSGSPLGSDSEALSVGLLVCL